MRGIFASLEANKICTVIFNPVFQLFKAKLYNMTQLSNSTFLNP